MKKYDSYLWVSDVAFCTIMEISRHIPEVVVMQWPVSLSLSSKILVNGGDWLDKAIYPQPSRW